MATGQRRQDSGKERKRNRPRNTSPEIILEIRDLGRMGFLAPKIHEKLEIKFAGDAPSVRTVRNILGDYGITSKPLDPSETWHWWEADDHAEIDVCLRFMAFRAASGALDPAHIRLSKGMAQWLGRIALTPAAELPAAMLDELVFYYSLTEQASLGTLELDLFIGFTPWRSRKAFDRYQYAITSGGPLLGLFDSYAELLARCGFSPTACQADTFESALAVDEGYPTSIEDYRAMMKDEGVTLPVGVVAPEAQTIQKESKAND